MLNLALKVAKVASVLRSCEKPISYIRKDQGNLKDKVGNEELIVGTKKDDLRKEVCAWEQWTLRERKEVRNDLLRGKL